MAIFQVVHRYVVVETEGGLPNERPGLYSVAWPMMPMDPGDLDLDLLIDHGSDPELGLVDLLPNRCWLRCSLPESQPGEDVIDPGIWARVHASVHPLRVVYVISRF